MFVECCLQYIYIYTAPVARCFSNKFKLHSNYSEDFNEDLVKARDITFLFEWLGAIPFMKLTGLIEHFKLFFL